MQHQQFREWLYLFVHQELGVREQQLLLDHLHDCAECRKEKEQLEKLFGIMHTVKPVVTQELLNQARRQFRVALHEETTRKPWWQSIRALFSSDVAGLQTAFASAFMLAVGLLIGYAAFHKDPAPADVSQVPAVPTEIAADDFTQGEAQITNIRFEDADPTDGQVEFSFEAVTPMRVKGNINDERVQKVLSYALVNEQNPGIRLRAVNALGNDKLKTPDQEVKVALISALKNDENAGVRKQALEGLQKFAPDQEIKEAFLHVLVKDTNPGMRVSAIKALESMRIVDEEVLDVLRGKLREEENDFIRLRARAVLQEAKQQQ